ALRLRGDLALRVFVLGLRQRDQLAGKTSQQFEGAGLLIPASHDPAFSELASSSVPVLSDAFRDLDAADAFCDPCPFRDFDAARECSRFFAIVLNTSLPSLTAKVFR